jgi:alpha-tubulin suppressor-like RCC1 family protein
MSLSFYDINSSISSINSTLSTMQNSITNPVTNPVTTTTTTIASVNSMVGAGKSHSVFLILNGKVMTCGDNTKGQLGIGSYISKNMPTYVKINATTDLTNVKSVYAGADHTIFLLNDGTVYVCGDNTYGQLGIGNNTNQTFAVQNLNLTTVKSISAGTYHTMFLLNDGSVKACGKNTNGQLGDGTTLDKNTLVNVIISENVKKVSCGSFHTMFLLNDGTVMGCGNNNNGQIGDGTKVQRLNPVYVKDNNGNNYTNVKDIASGTYHTIFLNNDGTAYGCGIYFIEFIANTTTPVYFAQSVTSIYSGYFSIIYVVKNGTFYTNGNNMSGLLGTSLKMNNYIYAPKILPLSDKTVNISIGYQHSLFYNNDSSFFSSGNNIIGQLGTGNYSTYEILKDVTTIYTDEMIDNNLTITRKKYSIYCCGENINGQLGKNNTTQLNTPTLIEYFVTNNIPITKVACGYRFTFFIDSTGKVYSCGLNSNGQLGHGTLTQLLVPTLIQYFVTNTIIITDAYICPIHVIFKDSTGKVYTCGLNTFGQLGHNNTTQYTVPTLIQYFVTNNITIISASGGELQSIFLDSTGKVYSCGRNINGQLGQNNTTQYNVPTLIQYFVTNNIIITNVACGYYHTVFLDSTGKVYSCGLNTLGQLGHNNTTQLLVPTLIQYFVTNNITITNVFCGFQYTMFLDSSGKVYGCGDNGWGQLGQNYRTPSFYTSTKIEYFVPTRIEYFVTNNIIIKNVACGFAHALFLDSNTKVYGCGYPGLGQIGLSTIAQWNIPTIIPFFSTNNFPIENIYSTISSASMFLYYEYEKNIDNILI